MKVVYTESGRQALEAFKDAKARELEEEIKARKYVYGDETVEITANDIREVADRVRVSSRLRGRYSSTQFVLQTYVVLGLLTSLAGFFYRDLRDIAAKDPTQLILIVFGAVFALMSYFMLQRMRVRDQEKRRIEMLEEEARKLEHDIIRKA